MGTNAVIHFGDEKGETFATIQKQFDGDQCKEALDAVTESSKDYQYFPTNYILDNNTTDVSFLPPNSEPKRTNHIYYVSYLDEVTVIK